MNDAVILNGKRHCLPVTKEYVLSEFKDVFEGIGKLPGGKYHIELKPDAQPVQHPPRAVPEKKKEAYKDELERLCSSGIIELVAGHTDWINSIVPVAKPDGAIRLCLDPKDLNNSIKRNQYYSKTIDEVSAELQQNCSPNASIEHYCPFINTYILIWRCRETFIAIVLLDRTSGQYTVD